MREAILKRKNGRTRIVVIVLITGVLTCIITCVSYPYIVKMKTSFEQIFTKKLSRQENSVKNKISIEFDSLSLKEIEGFRTEAINSKNIGPEQKEAVSAKVIIEDIKYDAKVRLKGDNIDHILTDKWSFRIDLEDSDNNLRFKVFSIQHPGTRSYMYEWILHKALADQGIITPEYDFWQVFINSQNMGIYAFEEHISSGMLINNKRTLGPVLRFNEEAMWLEDYQQVRFMKGENIFNETGNVRVAKISIYGKIAYDNKDSLDRKAIDILNDFRKGNLQFQDCFDVRLWTKYFAVMEVFGAVHGVRWHNVRFYYNPESGRIEPIGYDGSFASGRSALHIAFEDAIFENSNEYYLRLFFSNRVFMKQYLQELRNLLTSNFLENIFNKYQQEFTMYEEELKNEFEINEELFKDLNERIDYIETVYNPIQSLYAYKKDSVLMLGNSYMLPIQVISLRNGKSFQIVDSIILDGKSKESFIEYYNLVPECKFDENTVIDFRFLGQEGINKVKVENYYDN